MLLLDLQGLSLHAQIYLCNLYKWNLKQLVHDTTFLTLEHEGWDSHPRDGGAGGLVSCDVGVLGSNKSFSGLMLWFHAGGLFWSREQWSHLRPLTGCRGLIACEIDPSHSHSHFIPRRLFKCKIKAWLSLQVWKMGIFHFPCEWGVPPLSCGAWSCWFSVAAVFCV